MSADLEIVNDVEITQPTALDIARKIVEKINTDADIHEVCKAKIKQYPNGMRFKIRDKKMFGCQHFYIDIDEKSSTTLQIIDEHLNINTKFAILASRVGHSFVHVLLNRTFKESIMSPDPDIPLPVKKTTFH